MTIPELYHSLVGVSRAIQGELTIPDFTEADYEELYYTILEEIAPHIGNNYEYFYTKWARSMHRRKKRSRNTVDFYDPQYEKPLDQQTVREQLCVLKYFLEKRTYSRYATN